ncbi:hypothetical protein [Nonomuraea sp. NPDC048916]|uniref:hypothetical protein n=1 Tax=Nonomuraea sp. NPDC048916 TaxID=3154232 RepID=UPI0033C01019
MTYPDAIPISREAGYRTDTIGRWARGQFFGSVVSEFDGSIADDGDWNSRRRWYAYLHEFDQEGNYLESTVEYTGLGDEARQAAMDFLRDWLDGIPGLRYGDIAVRPFQFELKGLFFGLVLEDHDGMEHAELYPDRLGFHEPWDGSYDT